MGLTLPTVAETGTRSASPRCDHCGTPMPGATGPGPRYCCHGCAGAADLLRQLGLDDFYDLRARSGDQPPEQPPPTVDADLDPFDSPAFAERYVQTTADGHERICWAVAGLHCAACVWLLEHLPQGVPGLAAVRVNYAEASLETLHDPAQLDRGRLVATVARLGYRLRPWGDPAAAAEQRRQRRRWYLRLAVATASAMGAMHLSLSLFAGHATGDMQPAEVQFFGLIALVVALPALTWAAGPFYRGALAGLRAGRFTLDATIVAVLLIGTGASAINLLRASPEIWVDAMAMFVAFLLVGRVLLFATQEAVRRRSVWDTDLVPLLAERLRPDGGTDRVAVSALLPGERIQVAADAILPCDGTVVEAPARCDTAILTGESRAVMVPVGGAVHAGCRVVGGPCRLAVLATGSATRLGGLLEAVRQGSQAPTPRTALLERVQAGFAPVVALLAAATGLLWWWLEPSRAWDQAIAIVLVACPCALGLAAPLAYSLATHRAARRQIFLRDGGSVEALVAPRHVVCDKTGTLTEGRMAVAQWQWADEATADWHRRLAGAVRSCEAISSHPLAAAIEHHLSEQEPVPVEDPTEHIGQGLSARFAGAELRLGSPAWIGVDLEPAGTATVLGLTWDGRLQARIVVEDPLRPGIAQVLAAFPDAQLHLLSGDQPATVAAVAEQLGIADWQAAASPEAKAATVRRLQAEGPTVMFGDGVNDCLALQAADVGIAVRGGLEAAVAASTVYLPHVDSDRLLELIAGSRATVAALRRTLGWAIAYNLVAVALVMAGLWGPYVCAVAMPLSSLAVVLMLLGSRFFVAPAR